jgi:hypothetical protein
MDMEQSLGRSGPNGRNDQRHRICGQRRWPSASVFDRELACGVERSRVYLFGALRGQRLWLEDCTR